MTKEEKIAALDFTIEVLKKKKEKLEGEGEVATQNGGPGKDPLPPDPTHPKD